LKKYISRLKGQKFVIVEDLPEVGFYLYVFDENDKCIEDYLQDSLEESKLFAKDEFGVPIESWLKI